MVGNVILALACAGALVMFGRSTRGASRRNAPAGQASGSR
jgi:hypothetical protein